jgi:hypothetical protein
MQEGIDVTSYIVIGVFTDKIYRKTCPPERHQAVEHRSPGLCSLRLPVLENNVEYRLACTEYLSHNL